MSDIQDISSPNAPPSAVAGDIQADGILARPLSRRHLLTIGAAATGAVLVASTARADILDTLKGVLDLDDIVLNYAHEMEELQSSFFGRAVVSTAYQQLESRERGVFNQILMGDQAHLKLLDAERARRGSRGGGHFRTPNASASERPRSFTFPADAFRSREALLPMAVDIKESCLSAYHGAVDLLRDKKLLAKAAGIAGTDGRHLVILRELAGMDPIPTSFELQVSPQKIGNKLGRYGFRGGGGSGGLI